jgi:ABC-type bacteriocin/lantibiotic exporter with double-glycine peptidase domain
MSTIRIWSLTGALGLAALLLWGCGVSLGVSDEPRPTQYAALHPADEPVAALPSVALATLLRYEFGDDVTEKEVAHGLMRRSEYIEHPEIVQVREGFSLLDLKRYVQARGYKGVGLGKLELQDLIEHAPIMVPVDALGYNHFLVFRGVKGNRALLADPAWGNRTMTIEKFQRMWLNYGDPMGHVGFVVERADGREPPSRMRPKLNEFVMLQ